MDWVEQHRNPEMEGTGFDADGGRYVCPNCGGRGNDQMTGHWNWKDNRLDERICPKKDWEGKERLNTSKF